MSKNDMSLSVESLDEKLAKLELKESNIKKKTLKEKIQEDSDDENNDLDTESFNTHNLALFIAELHTTFNVKPDTVICMNMSKRLFDEIFDLEEHHSYDIDFSQYIYNTENKIIDITDNINDALMDKAKQAYKKDVEMIEKNRIQECGDIQEYDDEIIANDNNMIDNESTSYFN